MSRSLWSTMDDGGRHDRSGGLQAAESRAPLASGLRASRSRRPGVRRSGFRRGAALLLAMLASGVEDAHAASGTAVSPAFVLNTGTTLSTGSGVSPAFVVNTNSPFSTVTAVSPAFAVDLRKPPGQSGSRSSTGFTLDTRGVAGAQLTIVGPASVPAGSQTEYRVEMTVGGGGATDVTVPSLLGFTGPAPAWAGIGGTTLMVLSNAPAGASVQLQARYGNPGGQLVSAPLTVTVGARFLAGMTATPRNLGGSNQAIDLAGRASGGVPPYTYRWDTDGDGTYGDLTGATATASVTSNGGTVMMRLEVTDATSARVYTQARVALDKAAVPAEPPRPRTYDIGAGHMYGVDRHLFAFDDAKRVNGLVILTHGLFTDYTGGNSWIADMADRIDARLPAKPNIAIYDWTEYTNPSGDVNPYALAALKILSSAFSLAKSLLNAAASGIEAVVLATVDQITGVVLEKATEAKGGANGIALDASTIGIAADFVVDAAYIRINGRKHGQVLGEWMYQAAQLGQIDPARPIHLIGHSAGGFVVGEAALWLEQHPLAAGPYQGKTLVVDRVTMLDTPFPYKDHCTILPQATPTAPGAPVVERYVSSYYGGMEWGSTMVLPQTNTYRLTWLSPALAFSFSTGEKGHGLSHRWYRRTILPQGESDGATLDGYRGDGFDVSPMVTGLLVPRVPPAPGAPPPPPSAMPPPPPAVPLGGFASFGSVSSAGGTYTITEQANAGITQSLTIPLGAQSLRFRFKFSAAGDGDFLSVSFGGEFPLYDGLDTVLSRDGFTTVEVSMDGLAGRTGDLTFTLVSRGSANAVIEVADIEWIVDEDPDRDGLTNAQETTAGTDPLGADSDDDGLSDGQEAMLYRTSALSADSDGDGQSDAAEIAAGTDPGDGNSVMTVLAFSRAGSGVALRWASVRGKSYRVLRSSGPGFASYAVLGSGLVAAGTQMEYVDPTVLTALVPAMFYRVEVEDAPPAPELDSDRDGVPDAQEIAAASDPGRYDTDRDGLGDGEEMLVLLSSPIRPDTDGDGSGDWAELVAGTSPTNPASVLAITGIARNADGSVTLRWSGVAGRTYRVLRSATPDFAAPEIVAGGWPGFPPTTTFTDANATGLGNTVLFYKVAVE